MPTQIDIVPEVNNAGDASTRENPALQLPPDIVQFAERRHQTFLESLQSKLSVESGVDARASFNRTEQSLMARRLTDVEPGSYNVVLSLDPLPGCALLRFSSELLFKILDILLASPATVAGPRGESVTEIEFLLLRRFFKVFSDALKEAWPNIPQGAPIIKPEGNEERFSAFADLHSLELKSTLEINGAGSDFSVVIPAFLARLSAKSSGLKPAETKAAKGAAHSNRAKLTEALGSAKVDMDAVLLNLTIRIGDLLELVPGQILLADKAAESTFDCLVNKRPGFRGELVRVENQYGFQLARESSCAADADSPADR